jgi:hypothetical protein
MEWQFEALIVTPVCQTIYTGTYIDASGKEKSKKQQKTLLFQFGKNKKNKNIKRKAECPRYQINSLENFNQIQTKNQLKN